MVHAITLLDSDDPLSLVSAFEACCTAFSDDIAFSCMGQELSFRQLELATRTYASFFRNELEMQKGDRVAIQLPNINQYPIAAWAALRAGLIIVNTNPLYTERELLHQLSDSGARAIVMMSTAVDAFVSVTHDTDVEFVISVDLLGTGDLETLPSHSPVKIFSFEDILAAGYSDQFTNVPIDMQDIATLQYTGGTTGVAKGCMLSHGNIWASAKQLIEAIPIEDPGQRSIMIAPMPLYHVYGFQTNVISFFLPGGTSVLVPNPRDLDSLIHAMKSYPFTHLAGVNTLLNGLMRHPDFDAIDFSTMEYTFAGGTALAPSVAEEWHRRTHVQVYEGYSMSETSSALCLNTKAHRQLGTVGKPHSATEVKLQNPVGDDMDELRGQLLVRGPQVMQGYWQRPEATAEVLDADGWLQTGDIAVIQEDRFVRIVDRLKDMVLVSGFNVYPNEIDAVVSSHPDVIDCAAIGLPDERTGEAVKVYLSTSNASLTEADIKEFCRGQLTAYKVPKYVEFLHELPKSPAGKILRRELRELSDREKTSPY